MLLCGFILQPQSSRYAMLQCAYHEMSPVEIPEPEMILQGCAFRVKPVNSNMFLKYGGEKAKSQT